MLRKQIATALLHKTQNKTVVLHKNIATFASVGALQKIKIKYFVAQT